MALSHFVNGIRCKVAGHEHGCSCAVDVILELYYFAIYKREQGVKSLTHPYVWQLNQTCKLRDSYGQVNCQMREPVWDFLVANCPGAFAPKGTGDANADMAFEFLGRAEPEYFSWCYSGQTSCLLCGNTKQLSHSTPTFHYSQRINETVGGDLALGVRLLMQENARSDAQCTNCMCQSLLGGTANFPNFMIIDLGLHNSKNCMKPRTQINETMEVHDVTYELTGAVMTTPGHFSSIVKHDAGFTLIDDLSDTVYLYSTFAGAVSQNRQNVKRVHTLSSSDHGVFILVYHRTTRCNSVALTKVLADFLIETKSQQNHTHRTLPQGHSEKFPSKYKEGECMPNSVPGHSEKSPGKSQLREKVQGRPSILPSTREKCPEASDNVFKSISIESETEKDIKLDVCQASNKCMSKKVKKTSGRIDTPEIVCSFLLDETSINYTVVDGNVYLSCEDAFKAAGMLDHIRNRGYKSIDNSLSKHGLIKDESFLFKSKKSRFSIRTYVKFECFLLLLGGRNHKAQHEVLKQKLMTICSSLLAARNTASSVSETPGKKQSRTVKSDKASRQQVSQLQSILKECYQNVFACNKKSMIAALAKTVRPDMKRTITDSFEGIFSMSDVTSLLQSVPASKKAPSGCEHLLDEFCVQGKHKHVNGSILSVEDVVHLQENFSGTRLTKQLRKKVPEVMPSERAENKKKKEYWSEFKTILLPRRTSTGWQIDVTRLMEVLFFRYFWLPDIRHWRVYGDGREIGGRGSTFLALSILNNEAFLRGHLYQDPKEVFPVSIFYGSDSRDNLEENLGYPSSIDQVFDQCIKEKGDMFYLCGDEMFLEAVLDGNGVLGPTTSTGWNIYHEGNREQMGEVSSTTSMRTDLHQPMDREHPDSILKSIPIKQTVLCLLHALARCVEKFINLEIHNILSEANKTTQLKQDGAAYREDKISNLEANINKRGIRQGNFKVHFDPKGNPQPVKLNKDHAWTIISSAPQGQESIFPPIMHNVATQRVVKVPLSDKLLTDLGLKASYTETNLVHEIWFHFHEMISILKQDSVPELLKGNPEGSLRADDYRWGYSSRDVLMYKLHAEAFYQLFVLRYTVKELTPYMKKLVDYGGSMMESLPFSLGRFQSEGGEHVNYEHNSFYYNHTTRHGGRHKVDPILSIFNNMYKRISYSIQQDATEDGNVACEEFILYKQQHMAACTIQRNVRGWLVRNVLSQAKWVPSATSPEALKSNKAAVVKLRHWNSNLTSSKHMPNSFQGDRTVTNGAGILRGFNFVLVGTVPKIGKKKYSQQDFHNLIIEHGGRVKKKVPQGSGKGASTKRYVVLAEKVGPAKVPASIRQAIRAGFDVLSYQFVHECVINGQLVSKDNFITDLKQISSSIVKNVPLERAYFNKAKSMTSIIKGPRRKRFSVLPVDTQNYQPLKPGKHVAMFYVLKRRRELSKVDKINFQKGSAILKDLYEEYRQLPISEKRKHCAEFKLEKENIQLKRQKLKESDAFLASYNHVCKPAYKIQLTPVKEQCRLPCEFTSPSSISESP